MQREIVTQKVKHFGICLKCQKKDALGLATTEREIWKLLDILKALSTIKGMKIMIIFCWLFLADTDIH